MKRILLNIFCFLLLLSMLSLVTSDSMIGIQSQKYNFTSSLDPAVSILNSVTTAEILITTNTDFLTYSSGGTGLLGNPYIIEDYWYDSGSTDAGIYIKDTTAHFIIRNCSIKNYDHGIYIENTPINTSFIYNNTCNNNYNWGIYVQERTPPLVQTGSTIANNTCNNNYIGGIKLIGANYILVENNTCSNNYFTGSIGFFCYGILLESESYDAIVNNNTCENNYNTYEDIETGIFEDLGCGIYLVNLNTTAVTNNTLKENGQYNIYLDYAANVTLDGNLITNCKIGIFLENANHTEITMNEIEASVGIYSFGSDECIISYNEFVDCYYYAISLFLNSDLNIIHHNTFINNNIGGTSQANDNCVGNTWYDTTTLEGNWWSDWTSTNPYLIEGTANNFDNYPLGPPIVSEYSTGIHVILLICILCVVFVPLVGLTKKLKKKL